MRRAMFMSCGVVNALFVAFHLFLFFGIQTMPGIAPDVRALLHAFNVAGTLTLLFVTVAFLACPDDLGTRLGRLAVGLGALVYLTRGLAEVTLFPSANLLIAVACAAVGALHVVASSVVEQSS
ncbi:MAG: hypothetical protein QM765_33410 [Myxococcales bacterium]